MRYALANLLRNLRAGLRLCMFRRVSRLDFRVDLAQLLLLVVLSAGIDIAGDWVRALPPRHFSWLGAGSELYAVGVLLLTSAFIAIVNRQRPAALAIPVLALASLPVVQAIHYVPYVLRDGGEFPEFVLLAEYGIVLWIVAVLVRSVALAFAPLPPFGWLRAIGGGLLLAAPIWIGGTISESQPWWRGHQDEMAIPASEMNAGSEVVLAAQSFVLDHALDALQDERGGQADLYFVAYAPYAGDDAFREQAEAAQRMMDTRWDTDGRSLVLVNNPQTLVTAPFATVTHLREVLNEIGGAIDPDDDVVMLFLTSTTAANGKLAALLPPLTLVELGPAGLKQLLEDAGIKWRIIVVSACESGRFVQALQDEYTLVITDTSAGGTAFGCGGRTPVSEFADVFFGEAMAKANTFEAAFNAAKAKMAEREKEAGYSPGAAPQFVMGAEMAEKIKTLGRKGTAGATALMRTSPRG
ncbi:MAG: C13 family peptidase [Burkholderiales bacterium]